MQPYYGNDFEDKRSETAVVHGSAHVDAPCQIGDRSYIMPFSHIMAHSVIGHDCLIGQHVTISSGVLIGNHSRVMNNAFLISGVVMEEHVYCGPSTVFVPLNRARANQKSISKVSPTMVRQGACLGPNTTVSAGFTIGRFSFVEAGSVVDRNVPDYALMRGNPLRLQGWRCECSAMLRVPKTVSSESIYCDQCGRTYTRSSPHRIQPELSQPGQAFLNRRQQRATPD